MQKLFISAVAASAMIVAGAVQASPMSDGSIFFDTFDGPATGVGVPAQGSANASGGFSVFATPQVVPPPEIYYVNLAAEGIYVNSVAAAGGGPNGGTGPTEHEYRAEPFVKPAVGTEYIVETGWIIENNFQGNTENLTIMNGFDLTNNAGALVRIEAKPANFDGVGSANMWRAETGGSLIGPELPYSVSAKIVAHNLGDGTVDIWINDGFVTNVAAGGGDLEWIGNLGNNSVGAFAGGQGLLEYVSVGIPEPGTMALVALGGLAMLRRKR